MNQKWKIWTANTAEQLIKAPDNLFHMIKAESERSQAVGVILFGANSELKDDLYMNFVERTPNLAIGYGNSLDLQKAKRSISVGRSILVAVDGTLSGHWVIRRQIAADLRALGAKTIVGVYAKFYPLMRSDEVMLEGGTAEDKQAWALLNEPPAPDDFDYYAIVEEQKEV